MNTPFEKLNLSSFLFGTKKNFLRKLLQVKSLSVIDA